MIASFPESPTASCALLVATGQSHSVHKADWVCGRGASAVRRPVGAFWLPRLSLTLPQPPPSPDVCVSSNPKDWKCPLVFEGQERVEGNDVAGYVEAVGEGVTRFKKGDKVGAFTVMMTDDKYGAYAEYTISPQNTVFHLGPKTSFEDAAALPLAYITAAIGLFKRLKLPEPGEEGDRDGAVLVYGGATTVGVYALQLLKVRALFSPPLPLPPSLPLSPSLQRQRYTHTGQREPTS